MKKLAFVVVVLACFCWALGEAGVWGRAQERTALACGDWLVGAEPVEVGNSFEGITLMPKTQVSADNFTVSFTFKHKLWQGMATWDPYIFNTFDVFVGGRNISIMGLPGTGENTGKFGFALSSQPAPPWSHTEWFDLPEDEEIWEAEFDISYKVPFGALHSTVGQKIIGKKASVTHSKEVTFTDELYFADDATIEVTINGQTYELATSGAFVWGMYISASAIDADDWYGHLQGAKYAFSLEDIRISGNPIDTSEFAPTTWGGTAASVDKLWVEGFGGNSIGFWSSEYFYNGPYVYNGYEGGLIRAPFSYDFSQLAFKWMDDTNLPSTLEVYCTGLRNLNSSGIDIGPRKLTLAALAALGRYTQKTGCYYWNTDEPDMQASVALYLSLTSAEAHGIEIRGPRPEYKVEGAGWGQTIDLETEEVVPGPVDGQYWREGTYNTEPLYTNGSYYLYCSDPEEQDWAIGPGPPVAPYYVQWAGGPGGAYLVNLYDAESNPDGYKDSLVAEGSDEDDEETVGQRKFSGFAGYGIGPAVTADEGEAILVDSDCATPSFLHNATVCLDAWPLSATSRTASPHMTDVVSVALAGSVGIYGDAHDHEDWVATGAGISAPDALGAFVVGAGGGSLTFTPKCNYRDRQALVGGEDEVPVPTAYLCRQSDSCLGLGATPETAEGVWDWRGRYLRVPLKPPSVPQTIGVIVTYYDDLGGCSDNHKSDSTRQTEYTYDPGPQYELTRELTLEAVGEGGWGHLLVDLYNEQEPDHPVAMAYSVELVFGEAAAGEWELDEPTLPETDPGDANELLPGSPGYREEPGGDGLQLKIDESWQYRQGVVSAVVNGHHDRVLFVPDNAKACVVEKCLDTLLVLYGAKTGEDLTSCYLLSQWPFTVTGERFVLTHSPSAEAAHLVDDDDEALTALRCYDISPQMHGDGNLSCAVRCGEIKCVPGLPYTFRGTYYAGGQVQGWALKSALPDDFPRARGQDSGGAVYRRPLGSEDEADYEFVCVTGAADEHGRWQTEAITIGSSDDDRPLWEYALRHSGAYHSPSRAATREWLRGYVLVGGRLCYIANDAAGNPLWLACLEGGGVQTYTIIEAEEWWPSPAAALTGAYQYPSIVVMDDGSIIAAATNTAAGRVDVVRSRDAGKTWEAVNVSFGANLENGCLFMRSGGVYLAGWYNDKVWLVTSSADNLAREKLNSDGDTIIEVCEYEVTGDDKPVVSGVVANDGEVLVAVAGGGETKIYGCRNFGEGFTLQA